MGCGISKTHPETKKPDKKISLRDFEISMLLGKGGCGKVVVAYHIQQQKPYALKYISKNVLHNDRIMRHAITERNFLEALSHPSIVNLKYSFQDSSYLYLVLDYFQSGDLRKHITHRIWTEAETRIVLGELLCACVYLHNMNIVHRDIKPDNVLVDGNGHVFMSDFDLARTFTGRGINTMAGTEPYMAPEMFRGDYYTHSPDLWALGVILFEMVCGERPFRSKNRKEHILKGRYEIPRSIKLSKDCVNLIESLLQVKTVMRLGYPATEAVMDHPWFINVNWKRMNAGEEIPVYVPPNVCYVYRGDAENDLKAFAKKMKKSDRAPLSLNLEEFKYFDYTKMKRKSLNESLFTESQRSLDVIAASSSRRSSNGNAQDSVDWLVRHMDSQVPPSRQSMKVRSRAASVREVGTRPDLDPRGIRQRSFSHANKLMVSAQAGSHLKEEIQWLERDVSGTRRSRGSQISRNSTAIKVVEESVPDMQAMEEEQKLSK